MLRPQSSKLFSKAALVGNPHCRQAKDGLSAEVKICTGSCEISGVATLVYVEIHTLPVTAINYE